MNPIAADIYPSTVGDRFKDGDRLTILILQGVEIDKAEYTLLAQTLANMGFNVIVPNFIAPSGEYICPDPSSVARFLNSTDTILPEPHNFLQSGLILLGHSAGGIAAFSALTADSSPLEPFPQGIITYGSSAPRLDNLQENLPPTLMISGLKDTIVSPDLTQPGFENLPSTRKNLLSLSRFHHYSITDSGAPAGAPKQQVIEEPFGEPAVNILGKIIHAFLLDPQWSESLDAEVMGEIYSLE